MEVERNMVSPADEASPMRKLISVASIAAGLQFGWALQLSLLTPYVQLLGIPHKWASLIWLCGPISGMIVQPIVGFHSDRCTSRFGRRKPFIAGGTALVAVAVFLIGYAADLGRALGDPLGKNIIKTRAIGLFVFGFWILDVANNTLQGPCRALLADLAGSDYAKTRTSNAFFSFFMAVGNVLGYAAGSYTHLYHIVGFTHTVACDVYCANLKTCFFISITLLLSLTIIALCYVKEKPYTPEDLDADEKTGAANAAPHCSFIFEIAGAFKNLEKPMWILLLVTALNWVAWFPFLLFDTDWMGREVYGGDASGTAEQLRMYNNGVHVGALGLMLNSVVLGVMSLGIETVGRWVGGVKRLWGIVNFILAICLAMTLVVTKVAHSEFKTVTGANGEVHILPPSGAVKGGALAIFSVMGIPQAVTFSVPFALASIFCKSSGDKSTAGQGLSLGVLNLAIVIPQMFVSSVSGPFDDAFGGGNIPAFLAGAVAAAVSGVVVMIWLPSPPAGVSTKTVAGGFH